MDEVWGARGAGICVTWVWEAPVPADNPGKWSWVLPASLGFIRSVCGVTVRKMDYTQARVSSIASLIQANIKSRSLIGESIEQTCGWHCREQPCDCPWRSHVWGIAAAAFTLEEQALRPCDAEALAHTLCVSMQSLIHLGKHGVKISLPLQWEPKATTNLNAIAPSK